MTIATLAACLLAFGCLSPRAESPPLWRLGDAPAARVGCAEADAWIVKSGRQGVGVTLQLRAVDDTCAVRVESAVIVPDAEAGHPTARLPTGPLSLGHDPVYLYLPFPFDNLATWKRGTRHGELVVTVAVAAAASDLPNSRATTLVRSMYQWPSPTWEVDGWAREQSAMKRASAPYPPKASCASVAWKGGDGTDSVFQAVFTLVAAEPSCSLTVHAAEFLENGARVTAAGLPKQFALVKGRKDHLLLEFSLPSGPPSPYRVLLLEVGDAAGGRVPLEWPLFRASPFIGSWEGARQARGFDERSMP